MSKTKGNKANGSYQLQVGNQNEHSKQNVGKGKRNQDVQKPQQDIRRIGKDGVIRKTIKVSIQPPKIETLDKEIEVMAKKIRLDNDKKMEQLKNFSMALSIPSVEKPPPVAEAQSEDWTSVQGQFGWAEAANTTVPYLIRSGEKYVSLRIVENKIFFKFKNVFTDEVRSCFRVNILRLTPAEALLLNEINAQHCDNLYGRLEFTVNDGIVSFKDFIETHDFLNFCHLRLIEKVAVSQNRCGFIKIAGQNCVPYVWHEKKQYVPLFYFEGECKYLEDHSITVSGWDLAYLKLYCKIQGIRKALYDMKLLRVVELDLVKKFFPPDTVFEEKWPEEYKIDNLVQKSFSKVVFSQVQNKDKQPSQGNGIHQCPEGGAQKNVACSNKKAPITIPRKEQLPVTTNTTRITESVVETSSQSDMKLIQSHPITTTKSITCLNNLQVFSPLNIRVAQMLNNNKVPSPVVSQTKTIPSTVHSMPNGISFQKIFVQSTVSPTATPPNNTMAYKQPLIATPLSASGTYQKGSRILQIPEVTCNNAYYVVKSPVEDKFFQWCINLEPFITSILLVSLEESAMFFESPVELVVNAVNVMNLDLFLPNSMQKKELAKFKVNTTRGLLKLREFIHNLPQLRYILNKTKTFN